MNYQATNNNIIIETTTNTYIPMDLGNKDYQDYLLWLEAGNTPSSPSPPTPIQQASVIISNGLTVTCNSNSLLNGTYAITSDWQNRLTSVNTALALGKGFPHGEANISWPDITGDFHSFSQNNFIELSVIVEGYVSDVLNTETMLILGANSVSWPSSNVFIS